MLVQVVLGLFGNLKQVVGSSLLTVHVAYLGLFGSTDSSAPLVLDTFSSWQVLSAFSKQTNSSLNTTSNHQEYGISLNLLNFSF